MISRINLIMQAHNLTASQFADEIGVQRSSMSHILSGRNNPSLDFIMKILNRFPEIRTDWMLFGKGSMYVEQSLEKKEEARKIKELDLFSNQLFEESSLENKVSEKKDIVQENLSSSYPENKIKDVEEYPIQDFINKPIDKEESKYPNLMRGKSIKKVIIFFNDNTFEELVPNNN